MSKEYIKRAASRVIKPKEGNVTIYFKDDELALKETRLVLVELIRILRRKELTKNEAKRLESANNIYIKHAKPSDILR